MRVTEEIFKSIIKGSVTAYEDEQGRLRTTRFTPYQSEVIARSIPRNVYQQAGMRLDFYTDAEALEMAFLYAHNTSRLFMSVDVYVDGLMSYVYREPNCVDNKSGEFSYTFEKKGRKHVTVYLPFSVELYITKLELDGATYAVPYDDYSGFVYVIGDSITQGFDTDYTSYSYVNIAMRRLNLDYINQGVGGFFYEAESLDEHLFDGSRKPDMILLSYGSNDWSRKTREDFEAETEEYYKRLREIYPDIPVLSLTPVWRSDSYKVTKAGSFEYVRSFITATALAYEGIYVLNGDKLVPHMSEFFRDVRLHPSTLGFESYGIAVSDSIEKILGITPPTPFLLG